MHFFSFSFLGYFLDIFHFAITSENERCQLSVLDELNRVDFAEKPNIYAAEEIFKTFKPDSLKLISNFFQQMRASCKFRISHQPLVKHLNSHLYI